MRKSSRAFKEHVTTKVCVSRSRELNAKTLESMTVTARVLSSLTDLAQGRLLAACGFMLSARNARALLDCLAGCDQAWFAAWTSIRLT